jgi:hypothetical protein
MVNNLRKKKKTYKLNSFSNYAKFVEEILLNVQ